MSVSLQPARALTATLALSAGLACSGRAQRQSVQPAGPREDSVSVRAQDTIPAPPQWLRADSAARTVTLALEVTAPPDSSSALLNGLRAGAARITVPLGWTVQWDWRSADPGAPHSLVVMVQREKIPLEGGRPSFTNARTRMVTEGLAAGQTDHTSFEADEAGWYWLMCGVPGHALKGEWLELRVDQAAGTAGVQIKTGK
jgi:sulfocyanin SoxE-like protein